MYRNCGKRNLPVKTYVSGIDGSSDASIPAPHTSVHRTIRWRRNILNGCASAMMALSRDCVTQTCFQSDISRSVTEWPCSSTMAGKQWGLELFVPGNSALGPSGGLKDSILNSEPPHWLDSVSCSTVGQPWLSTRGTLTDIRMSKLSFRPRALDASKPMSIYMAEELPDLLEYSAITRRAVPQMPSGMEKEEECVSKEHLAPRSSMFSASAILPICDFVNNRQMAILPSSRITENC